MKRKTKGSEERTALVNFFIIGNLWNAESWLKMERENVTLRFCIKFFKSFIHENILDYLISGLIFFDNTVKYFQTAEIVFCTLFKFKNLKVSEISKYYIFIIFLVSSIVLGY